MDTDQNNGDRNETKAALLGELESIKDLLSEEEMADIPLLDQPLDRVPEVTASVDEANTEIPLLTDIPLLGETVRAESLPNLSNDDTELPAQTPSEPTDDTSFETLSESIDAALANISVDIDLTDETKDIEASANEHHYEQDSPVDNEDASITGQDLDDESEFNTNTEDESAPSLEHDIDESPFSEEPLDNHADSIEASEEQHPDTEKPKSIETVEDTLPEGVLPGQRNLFDESVVENNTPEPQSTQQPDTPERVKKGTRTQSKPRAKIEQAKGENPFLPKHIRERLHTTKSLMEVIKEAPLNTQAVYHNKFVSEHPEAQLLEQAENNKTDKLNEHDKLELLINEVIAEFMPKIEAELRARLTSLASSNSGINQSTQMETEEGLNEDTSSEPSKDITKEY